MECWEFSCMRIESAVKAMFYNVIGQGHGFGLVQTIPCEINGARALEMLLRIRPDTAYTLTETGFTLDTTMMSSACPRELAWALDEETRARL
jgi:hypothetical protein